jgi:aspartate aminotransferase
VNAQANPVAEVGVGEILAEVARMRATGRTVIPLHTGEPDFVTPKHIVDAGVAALRAGQTHYTPAGGLPELREAVIDEMRRTRGLDLHPNQVVVTPGAKMAIHIVMQALCNPGDEVICIDPSYGAYAALARLARAKVRYVPADREHGFRLDLGLLERSLNRRTRLIVLSSPCNPTGHVLGRTEIEALARIVQAFPRALVLSDEIYSRIVYDATFASPVSETLLSDRTIVVDGVSKAYAMTGWRVGYAVLPAALAADAARVALDTFLCVNGPAQVAAAEALRGPQEATAAMVSTYRRRRDVMIAGLNAIPGVRAHQPIGAFYAWVDARSLGMTSSKLSLHLLKSAGVATYPGTAFGPSGEGFVRLTFATSDGNIDQGLERIAASVHAIHQGRNNT